MGKLPNFMIIGAGKSGTTALYEYLNAHPEVYMSPVKETNFFALEGTKMVTADQDPDQMFHYPWSVTNWSDYCNLFEKVQDEKAIGEVSPMYMYSPIAATKIKERLPEVKIIAILRDPVDRLYSRYMHLARERREPSETFADALDRSSIWWTRNDLVQEGFYFQHLSNYFNTFDSNQIRVFLYDDLKKNPMQVVKSIYEFIGVNINFSPDVSEEFNVSGIIQNNFADKLIGQNSIIKKAIKTLSPGLHKTVIANVQLRRWVNNLRKSNMKKAPLAPEVRSALIERVYGGEILKLQWLLKKDLTNWLQTPSL